MIQLYRADLPADVAGLVMTDGEDVAVLVNPAYVPTFGTEWPREVSNTLLAAVYRYALV